MLTNININKMNQLTSENETAKQIVSQLLENHQTIVSMISHEIRNPLTLVSSALQIIEIQHPEVINFHGWSQAIEDIELTFRFKQRNYAAPLCLFTGKTSQKYCRFLCNVT